jgi:hypothetical protein
MKRLFKREPLTNDEANRLANAYNCQRDRAGLRNPALSYTTVHADHVYGVSADFINPRSSHRDWATPVTQNIGLEVQMRGPDCD